MIPQQCQNLFQNDINLGSTFCHLENFQGRYTHSIVAASPDPDNPSQQYFVQAGVQTLDYHTVLAPPEPFTVVEYLEPDANPTSNQSHEKFFYSCEKFQPKKQYDKTYLKPFKPSFSSLVAPVTPMQPATMPLNQEVEEESNRIQSDSESSDSAGSSSHVSASILGFTSQDDSDLDHWMKYHRYKSLQDVIEKYYTQPPDLR